MNIRLLPCCLLLAACGTDPTPSLTLDGDSIIFEDFGALPAPRVLPMTATTGTITWSASSNVPWLTVAPPTGTTPDSLTVTADANGRLGGALTGLVSIVSTAGDIQIPVRLQVPDMTGHWSGSIGNATFAMDLVEAGGTISGTGTATSPGFVDPVTFGGIHVDHPIMQLTFTIPGLSPFTFFGTFVSKDELIGVVVGSGFSGQTMGLFR